MVEVSQTTAPSPRQTLNSQGVRRIPARNNARTHPKVEKQSSCRLGTWNVRTLYTAGKLDNLVQEMERHETDILGLGEVKWLNSGQCTTEKATLYYSGNNHNNHCNGVGFIVHKNIGKSVKNFIAHSDRAALIRLKAAPVDINIIQVYAPTLDKPDTEMAQLYKEIKELMKLAGKKEVLIIMGDFNAKIGRGRVDSVVGDFGLGDRNKRGDTLVQFCQEERLVVANTWYKLPLRRLYTWQSPQHSPDNIVRNQIDFLLISQRYRNGLHGVRTYPGTDIGSDHNPVVGTLNIKLKKIRRPHKKKIDINNIKRPEIRTEVHQRINRAVSLVRNSPQQPADVEVFWNRLKDAITTTTNDIVGPPINKRREWMTYEILGLMSERRSYKNKDQIRYRELDRRVKKEIRKAKEQWLRRNGRIREKT
ncbi:craniofacial development protein 2-like [Cylas formicarius]|uniref:craniofacial development protein 2-like n=1 Tax=Cylas formicarius TaxID=197179 RepID=UPI0029585025|nr:craniofacial development protein 2-like [Cylas formicarius]